MRSWQRWAAVASGIAVLVAVPSIIAARPVHGTAISAAALLERVQASSDLAYSGLVQSEGTLDLPGIPNTGDIASLLSSTNRLRVWWSSKSHYRVDELAADGEFDTTVDGETTAQWDSTRDRATFTTGQQPLRVPRPDDLLPPALATRLTPRDLDARVSRLPAVRIAGRTALGLRITPLQPETTIRYVDIEVDQATGLPLGVSITGKGETTPAVRSSFLDVSIGAPPAAAVAFRPANGAFISTTPASDFIADVNRYAPFALPGRLAGLPRSQRVSGLNTESGAATYGQGYALLLLLPVLPNFGAQIMRALGPPVGVQVNLNSVGNTADEERIALGNIAVFSSNGRWYVLAGTVTDQVLRTAARSLIAHPPPFRHSAIGAQ